MDFTYYKVDASVSDKARSETASHCSVSNLFAIGLACHGLEPDSGELRRCVSQINWHLMLPTGEQAGQGKVERGAEIKLFNCAIKCTFVTFCATSVPKPKSRQGSSSGEQAQSGRDSKADRKFNC